MCCVELKTKEQTSLFLSFVFHYCFCATAGEMPSRRSPFYKTGLSSGSVTGKEDRVFSLCQAVKRSSHDNTEIIN